MVVGAVAISWSAIALRGVSAARGELQRSSADRSAQDAVISRARDRDIPPSRAKAPLAAPLRLSSACVLNAKGMQKPLDKKTHPAPWPARHSAHGRPRLQRSY